MPFQNIESAFLKDEVGPILAKGLAETAIACPSDPVEYLAIWLLHYLQLQELKEKERMAVEVDEKEREDHTRARQVRQITAALSIQRAWKQFRKAEEDRRAREKQLLEAIQERERSLEEDEEFREQEQALQTPEGGDLTELEREKAADRARAQLQFKKAVAMLGGLDKAAIAAIKKLRKPSASTLKVVRCCLYLQGSTPKQVRQWSQICALVKPAVLLDRVQTFQPIGSKKRRQITRVRRVLKSVVDEEVRQDSVAAFVLFQWCTQVAELRVAHDEDVKAKKAAGRELEEEEEEEEEDPENMDPADRDPDEEAQRQVEEEERKRREEEEAKWRAENGEDEEAAGDEE